MQTYALIFAAALMGMTSAQTTTTSLLLVGFDKQSILGSVVGSDSTATTYALNCGSQDETECGLPSSFTFTQGPSTVHYVYSVQGEDGEGQETIDVGCEITSADHGVCSHTMNGVVGTVTTSTSATESFSSGEDIGLLAVTITAGAAAGSPNTVSQTSSPASSSSSSSSSSSTSTSATGKASSTSGASETSRTAAPAGAATSSNSTGGSGAMITKAPWIVGGAAAALGYAAM